VVSEFENGWRAREAISRLSTTVATLPPPPPDEPYPRRLVLDFFLNATITH